MALPALPAVGERHHEESLVELRRLWPKERPLVEISPGTITRAGSTHRRRYRETPSPSCPPRDRAELLVVFSAHGLPISEIRKGDPYQQYVELSARGTAERCGLAPAQWKVTFQSRVGP